MSACIDLAGALDRELRNGIARNARLLKLSEHNGYGAELVCYDHTPGLWWYVPQQLIDVAGCMMARVA